jgi:hypothetical protein
MFIYPVAVVATANWLGGYTWFRFVAALCLLAWFGACVTFIANALRRQGYRAAVEDLKGPPP